MLLPFHPIWTRCDFSIAHRAIEKSSILHPALKLFQLGSRYAIMRCCYHFTSMNAGCGVQIWNTVALSVCRCEVLLANTLQLTATRSIFFNSARYAIMRCCYYKHISIPHTLFSFMRVRHIWHYEWDGWIDTHLSKIVSNLLFNPFFYEMLEVHTYSS